METLADALPKEIARVTAKKERWQAMMRDHPETAPGMAISVAIMGGEIEAAIQASASGDVAAMMGALESLRGYNDDD